ncbi:glycosyltransferase [Thermogladius sp. 4427co]|uniref:glycosyltransferase n=1 Tax=Thermogladius sp. 4427co TaxID=3450718 RepID=UPI003F7ABE71
MVTFNSMKIKHILDEALDHLLKVSYRPLEIIIVDNGSTDGTFEYIRKVVSEKAPRDVQFKLLRLSKNYGFAIANNIAFLYRNRESKYVVLINNDLAVEPHSLEILIKFLEENKDVAGVQGKILTWDGRRIDSAGCFMDVFLGTYTRCQGASSSACNEPMYVGYIDGAFSIYRVDALLKASKIIGISGIFIPFFFMYGDDYELGTRLQKLLNYKLMYLPLIVGRHYRSATVKVLNNPIYEYWGWLSEIAVRVLYDRMWTTKMLLIFPIAIGISLLKPSKYVIRGFISGIIRGIKLSRKIPRIKKLQTSRCTNICSKPYAKYKLMLILMFRYLLKYGRRGSKILYLVISRCLGIDACIEKLF